MGKVNLKKPKPRRWTAWAVFDCKWKTIREVETYPSHLNPIDCPDCEVIKVTIEEVK